MRSGSPRVDNDDDAESLKCDGGEGNVRNGSEAEMSDGRIKKNWIILLN